MASTFNQFIANKDSLSLSDLIKEANKHFSNLYTGNCGTFALALFKILQEQGVANTELAVIVPVEIEREEELFGGEYDLYHVFLISGGKWMDGIKVYKNANEAIDTLWHTIATASHGGGTSYRFSGAEINQNFIINVIHANTDYSVDENTIYNWMKTFIKQRKIVIQ